MKPVSDQRVVATFQIEASCRYIALQGCQRAVATNYILHSFCSSRSAAFQLLAMAFAQLRARIGASRLALNDTEGAMRAMASKLQTACILELLTEKSQELSPEDKCKLSTLVGSAGFETENAMAIMSKLSSETIPSIPSQYKRRGAQHMEGCIHYMQAQEWEAAKVNFDNAAQIFVSALVHRLGGVNADENTLKRVASVAMLASEMQLVPHPRKQGCYSKIKEVYRRSQRLAKLKPSSLPYIVDLPNDPQQLIQQHPEFASLSQIDFVEPAVSMQDITMMETSFGARGKSYNTDTNSSEMEKMMQLVMQCMQQRTIGSANTEHYDDLDIRYNTNPRKKRCLRAMLEERPPQQPRPLAAHTASSVASDDSQEVHAEIPASSQRPEVAANNQASGVGSRQLAIIDTTIVQQAPTEIVQQGPSRGAQLLDALQAREAEKVELKKIAKQEEKLAKQEEKLAKQAEQLAEQGKELVKQEGKKLAEQGADLAKQGRKELAKQGGKELAKQETKLVERRAELAKQDKVLAIKGMLVKVGTAKTTKRKNLGVAHEGTREQFLARSENGSKSFGYGSDKSYKTPQAAKKAAEAWYREQNS